MVFLAAAEILTIFTGILLLIWRLQFIFPEFGFILLGILVLTLLVHRDGWRNLGFGSHGFVSGMKALFAPTMILSMGFILGGIAFGAFRGHSILNWTMLPVLDRKSTRLNSSHGYISYAVFCLKKKKNTEE